MLLLVIDTEEKNLIKKRQKYLKILNVVDVLSAKSIDEARNIINKFHCPECPVVINFLIVEKYLEEHKSLIDLSSEFKGVIILRVSNCEEEEKVIDLLKRGVITEYFLADDNESVEDENIKKAFNIAIRKKNFNTFTRRFEDTVDKIKAVQKLITK